MRHSRFDWYACALLLVFGLGVMTSGCRMTAPGRGMEDDIHSRQDIAANTEQARLRMRALVEPFCGAIVASANQIMEGTTNHAIRRAALVWKIEAVPALRQALFRPNPFAAVLDSWVLLIQMTDYFKEGQGQQALGEAAPIAVATCQHLESELMRAAATLTRSGDVTDVRDFARQWAAAHPVRHSIASRESTLSRVAERELQETFSAPEVAGNMIVTLDDLSRRVDVFSAQLFEQSRWQAELFALDLTRDYQLDRAVPLADQAVQSAVATAETAEQLVPPLQRALAVVETVPEMVASERATTVQALHEEITSITEFIQGERIETLQLLVQERELLLVDLHRLITEERQILTQDMERISLNSVDRAFLRAAQLAAAILIVVFVGLVLLLFLTRRVFPPK